ncbi:MAG: protein translocase subunit SecF, partial [Chitinophagaceae bacterium]
NMPAKSGPIFIEPVLFNIPLAIGDRSETLQDLQHGLQGERFSMEGSRLRLFMHWGSGLEAQHMDMDLSCMIAYDDRVETCSYFSLQTTGCKHSGDIRSIPDKVGTAEYIEIDTDALEKEFGSAPVIKTYGSNSKYDITTDYLINQEGVATDNQVKQKLYNGLKPFLGSVTEDQFYTIKYIEQTKKVDPTISDDLQAGAKWATFWSLLVITLYIFIRFRDWRYSVGTIVALLHDVLVTLIVFSFFKNIVPFPLEIDQHFIAAILTVIGFSMNDTVIVYDRIREDTRLMKGEHTHTIVNRAINQTLSRTVMTSFTVFLTILILFLVGGEVTRGFAFAMLIGVVTGTYSSIFVAAPLLVDLARNKPLGKPDATAVTAPAPAPSKTTV